MPINACCCSCHCTTTTSAVLLSFSSSSWGWAMTSYTVGICGSSFCSGGNLSSQSLGKVGGTDDNCTYLGGITCFCVGGAGCNLSVIWNYSYVVDGVTYGGDGKWRVAFVNQTEGFGQNSTI